MVTTEREDLANRVRLMSLHGLSGDAWRRYADKGSWYYEVLEFGFKYNMTDVAAALGVAQLRRCNEFAKRRREIAGLYSQAFAELDTCVVPRVADDAEHAWHLYILELEPDRLAHDRAEVVRRLQERGIHTSVHFIPLHLHPAYQRACGYQPGDFPVAETVFSRVVSLPIYPGMRDEDVAYVIEGVRQTLAAVRR
jgi:perosamine synthetase